MRLVNWGDRKNVAAALKLIYQAGDADAARIELEAFKASELAAEPSHRRCVRERVGAFHTDYGVPTYDQRQPREVGKAPDRGWVPPEPANRLRRRQAATPPPAPAPEAAAPGT
jgi:hypothetical protein